MVVAVLAPAAAFAADQPSPAAKTGAQRDCRQQLSQMGAAVFKAKYGSGPQKVGAFGRCVSATAAAGASR